MRVQTVAQLRGLVGRLSVEYPFKTFGLQVGVDERRQGDADDPLAWGGGTAAAMMCTIAMPHRETGRFATVHKPFLIPLPCDEHAVLELCRKSMRDLLLHELDESLHFDGQRAWDPHR